MNATEAIEKLKKYKSFEGKTVNYKGESILIRKVIAAPYNLDEYTDNYRHYVENSEATVLLNLSSNYDIYFYNDPYASVAFYIRLDDFERTCL